MKDPLMPTDNVQISDVLNSHLINPGFLCGQKPILHAAEYNNSQGDVGGPNLAYLRLIKPLHCYSNIILLTVCQDQASDFSNQMEINWAQMER